MASFGVSFVPGGGDDQQKPGPGGSAPSGVSPLQSAVQILSARLPRFGGAGGMMPGGLAPQGLLQGQGSGGASQALLMLLRALAGQGPMAGGAPGAVPSPRVIPGELPLPESMPAAPPPSDGILQRTLPPPGRPTPGQGGWSPGQVPTGGSGGPMGSIGGGVVPGEGGWSPGLGPRARPRY